MDDEVYEGVVIGHASCCQCGGTEGVGLAVDPYVLELDDAVVLIDICPPCLAYRHEEI